jgi:hypothetical protein
LFQNKGKAMNHHINLIILFALLLTILFCSNEPQQIEIEKVKAAIEKVINTSIGWAKDKNLDLLYNSIAQDSSFLSIILIQNQRSSDSRLSRNCPISG